MGCIDINKEDREWFNCIEKRICKNTERLAKIEEQNVNQFKLLKKIDEKLFGNGQEGICTTLTKHKVYFALIGTALAFFGGYVLKNLI